MYGRHDAQHCDTQHHDIQPNGLNRSTAAVAFKYGGRQMHNRRKNGQTDEEMDKSGQANADMLVTQTLVLSKKIICLATYWCTDR